MIFFMLNKVYISSAHVSSMPLLLSDIAFRHLISTIRLSSYRKPTLVNPCYWNINYIVFEIVQLECLNHMKIISCWEISIWSLGIRNSWGKMIRVELVLKLCIIFLSISCPSFFRLYFRQFLQWDLICVHLKVILPFLGHDDLLACLLFILIFQELDFFLLII